jgi:ribokinase
MNVTVLGSANVDVVLQVPHVPVVGETVLALSATRVPGGKGANQAVAAARAGASTTFLGAIGKDSDGDVVRGALGSTGVDVTLLREVGAPTGVAVVNVAADGQNSIVVAAGANGSLTALTAEETTALQRATVLLCQLETPLSGVLAAAHAAHTAGVTVLLNAAPVRDLPDELWNLLDVLIVNEHEAFQITGASSQTVSGATEALLARVERVVITRGASGVSYAARHAKSIEVAGLQVRAVDTTGAGDTFCGVLAAALAAKADMSTALHRANAAAALSVQLPGAIPSIPTAAEIDAALTTAGLALASTARRASAASPDP